MRFKRAKEDEPVFSSIAPLIDIVFLLLIFFMVTAHSPHVTGLSVSLPEAGAEYAEVKSDSVFILIDSAGALTLDGMPIEDAALARELARLRLEGGPFHLIMEADRQVNHGRIIEVMDTAKQAGAASIIIAARLAAEKEPSFEP